MIDLNRIYALEMMRKRRLAGGKYFTVELYSASSPFTYSFTPYITSGESFWVDWGDASEETFDTASTTEKSHVYSTPGTKTVRMLGSAGINRVRIAPTVAANALNVVNSNGLWEKLGTIIDGTDMFNTCENALFAFADVPESLLIGQRMFRNCKLAPMVISELPPGMNGSIDAMFASDFEALLTISKIPANVTIQTSVFYYCTKSTIPLNQLATNPLSATLLQLCQNATACTCNVDDLTGDYSNVNNIVRMFQNCPLVTGDAGAFVSRCAPGVNYVSAFSGTACTNIPT